MLLHFSIIIIIYKSDSNRNEAFNSSYVFLILNELRFCPYVIDTLFPRIESQIQNWAKTILEEKIMMRYVMFLLLFSN